MVPHHTLSAAKEVLTALHTNTLSANDKALLADIFAAHVDDEHLAEVISNREFLTDKDYLYAMSGDIEVKLQAFYKSL